jgi:hypothetical protein
MIVGILHVLYSQKVILRTNLNLPYGNQLNCAIVSSDLKLTKRGGNRLNQHHESPSKSHRVRDLGP